MATAAGGPSVQEADREAHSDVDIFRPIGRKRSNNKN